MVPAYKFKDYFDAILSVRHFILRPSVAFRLYKDVKNKKTKFPCLNLVDGFWDIFEESLAVNLIAVDYVYRLMMEHGWDGKTWLK